MGNSALTPSDLDLYTPTSRGFGATIGRSEGVGGRKVEFVSLPSDSPAVLPSWLSGLFGDSAELLNLYGEHGDLERIAAADLVLVCSSSALQLQKAVRHMRAARLDMPVVACLTDGQAGNDRELLDAGFDDVFRETIDPSEVAARVRSLSDRAMVYRKRSSASRVAGIIRRSSDRVRVYTKRESAILKLLQERQGRVAPYEEILLALQMTPSKSNLHMLQVVISNLRHKIPDEWEIISANKHGYILNLNR